mgnify:FL=1
MNNKKKRSSIKSKLLALFLPLVAFSFVLILMIVYIQSQKIIQNKTDNLMQAESSVSINQILSWEASNLTVLDTAVDSILHLNMSDEQILTYEMQFLNTYEDFPNGMYIGYDDGKVLDASGWEPDTDIRQSTWYTEGLTHDTFEFGEPYIDALTGEYIVTASRRLDNLNGKTAVAAADVSLSVLSEIVDAMEVAGNGDAFILDTVSTSILAHKDFSLVGTPVAECSDPFYQNLYMDISSGNTSCMQYSSVDGTYMVNIQNITGTNWYIISRGLESNIYSDITRLQIMLAGIGLAVIIILCICMTLLINHITKPIHTMTTAIETVTSGNFTVDIDVTGNDEMSIMAQNMKIFLKTMRDVLGAVSQVATEMDSQARSSHQVATTLYDSASGQAESMEQMRHTLEELADSINVIADNATTLAQVVSETNESGNHALQNMETTISSASEGQLSMSHVTECMQNVTQSMTELEQSISDVGAAAVKIDEITTAIRDIAEETNLLSLNASIEAARAGEAGSGFAVVATQIKKLAETSASAADEISVLINTVVHQIEQTVSRSQQSMEQIKTSSDAVDSATAQFNKIYESIQQTDEIVHNIINQIYHVNDVSTNMAAITEEQSASATEIEATAANIQELSNTVSQNSADVKQDSQTLALTADALKNHMNRFIID